MDIILAQPRGFCAGVFRAIEIVETALDIYGAPVYVVHEIVHNQKVVDDLRERGAVFVETLADVPDGSVAIFSAHGVSREMLDTADKRDLEVINATCPLVTKVHLDVVRNARQGREVVLIGHQGHPEVIGTLGHYDHNFGGNIYLVQDVAEAEVLQVNNPDELSYVTQTTLSLDDTANIVAALKQRFPALIEPKQDNICYATQNRQVAVRELVEAVDILIIVGARNSSNSNRLREVGEQMGVEAYLVQDENELETAWFSPAAKVGVSAGASTPEVLVENVLLRLQAMGVSSIREMEAEGENVMFRLPKALMKKINEQKKQAVESEG